MSSGIPIRDGVRTEALGRRQHSLFKSCPPSVRDKSSTATTICYVLLCITSMHHARCSGVRGNGCQA
uniref:Uncharacterized protein n=1 Tax=Arundo donax TaxID=35708 RepID=A0A0A8YHZ5_ARUDO